MLKGKLALAALLICLWLSKGDVKLKKNKQQTDEAATKNADEEKHSLNSYMMVGERCLEVCLEGAVKTQESHEMQQLLEILNQMFSSNAFSYTHTHVEIHMHESSL